MKERIQLINYIMDQLFDNSIGGRATMSHDEMVMVQAKLYEETKDLLVDLAEELDEEIAFRDDVNRKLDKLTELVKATK